MIRIVVIGEPAPQGSKKFVGMMTSKKTGKQFGAMSESSRKTLVPWRRAVKKAGELAMNGNAPLDGPLVVSMIFTMPKPKSAPKTRKTYPCRKPDLSKLARATEDALTDAGVWTDDARIVKYANLSKVFPGEDAFALSAPGVLVEIAQVSILHELVDRIAAGTLFGDKWKPTA